MKFQRQFIFYFVIICCRAFTNAYVLDQEASNALLASLNGEFQVLQHHERRHLLESSTKEKLNLNLFGVDYQFSTSSFSTSFHPECSHTLIGKETNTTERLITGQHNHVLECFRKGKSEDGHRLFLSTCDDGIHGVMRHANGSIANIQTLHGDLNADSSQGSEITSSTIGYWRRLSDDEDIGQCGLTDQEIAHQHEYMSSKHSSEASGEGRKLATIPDEDKLYLEIVLFNSQSRFEAYGKSTLWNTLYVAGLSQVFYDELYIDTPDNGSKKHIGLVIRGIYTFVEDPQELQGLTTFTGKVDASRVLDSFNDWVIANAADIPSHDLRHLLHGTDFYRIDSSNTVSDSVLGLAYLSGACNPSVASGITQTANHDDVRIAMIFTHEVGHNLGLSHSDSLGCDGSFIMNSLITNPLTVGWSQCSKDGIQDFLSSPPVSSCLSNLGQGFEFGATCGNGIVEKGEECDCLGGDCSDDPCCDGATCMLQAGAKCSAFQPCCTSRCTVIPAHVRAICRDASSLSCDTAEYCDGVSAGCGVNSRTTDGAYCELPSQAERIYRERLVAQGNFDPDLDLNPILELFSSGVRAQPLFDVLRPPGVCQRGTCQPLRSDAPWVTLQDTIDDVLTETCGNGVVDPGEECDCVGGDCSVFGTDPDPCCDGATCTLRATATCSAHDTCCNPDTCEVKAAGAECRASRSAFCDSEETCDGVTSTCPADVMAPRGTPCPDTEIVGANAMPQFEFARAGACYEGICISRTAHCANPAASEQTSIDSVATAQCGTIFCTSQRDQYSLVFSLNGNPRFQNGTPCCDDDTDCDLPGRETDVSIPRKICFNDECVLPTQTTNAPTMFPTLAPTGPTTSPTQFPTELVEPTVTPTNGPTSSPTNKPTVSPTAPPTASPLSPTNSPSLSPVPEITVPPSTSPTRSPNIPIEGDNICGAIDLGALQDGQVLVSETINWCDASSEPNEPLVDGDQTVDNSVWFTFEAQTSCVRITIDMPEASFPFRRLERRDLFTFATGWDSQGALYKQLGTGPCASTAPDFDNLSFVAADANADRCYISTSTFEISNTLVDVGSRYYVQVDGINVPGVGTCGEAIVHVAACDSPSDVNFCVPPANDDTCSPIDMGTVPVGGRLLGNVTENICVATAESTDFTLQPPRNFDCDVENHWCLSSNLKPVWFTFTAASNCVRLANLDPTKSQQSQVAVYELAGDLAALCGSGSLETSSAKLVAASDTSRCPFPRQFALESVAVLPGTQYLVMYNGNDLCESNQLVVQDCASTDDLGGCFLQPSAAPTTLSPTASPTGTLCSTPIMEDNACSATDLGTLEGSIEFKTESTCAATDEPGEPRPIADFSSCGISTSQDTFCNQGRSQSIWYKFTAGPSTTCVQMASQPVDIGFRVPASPQVAVYEVSQSLQCANNVMDFSSFVLLGATEGRHNSINTCAAPADRVVLRDITVVPGNEYFIMFDQYLSDEDNPNFPESTFYNPELHPYQGFTVFLQDCDKVQNDPTRCFDISYRACDALDLGNLETVLEAEVKDKDQLWNQIESQNPPQPPQGQCDSQQAICTDSVNNVQWVRFNSAAKTCVSITVAEVIQDWTLALYQPADPQAFGICPSDTDDSDFSGLNLIAANDDSGCAQSLAPLLYQVPVTANTDYWIQLASSESRSSSGRILIESCDVQDAVVPGDCLVTNTTCALRPVNLALVVDDSGSIDNTEFQSEINLIIALTRQLASEGVDADFSLVVFGTRVHLSIGFGGFDDPVRNTVGKRVANVEDALRNYIRFRGSTGLSLALDAVGVILNQVPATDRNRIAAIAVFTDGSPNCFTCTETSASNLKALTYPIADFTYVAIGSGANTVLFESVRNRLILGEFASLDQLVTPLTTDIQCGVAAAPTGSPTRYPTSSPVDTNNPTTSPSAVQNSIQPTSTPTKWPSTSPTKWPSTSPTKWPSASPTKWPTASPTKWPSTSPTKWPSTSPTKWPSTSPTKWPTANQPSVPTSSPSNNPSSTPTKWPTNSPSLLTASPSSFPTTVPTASNVYYTIRFLGTFDPQVHDTDATKLELKNMLSSALLVDSNRLKLTRVASGSILVDFEVSPDSDGNAFEKSASEVLEDVKGQMLQDPQVPDKLNLGEVDSVLTSKPDTGVSLVPEGDELDGDNTGAVAGAAVGAVLGVGLLGAVIWRAKKQKGAQNTTREVSGLVDLNSTSSNSLSTSEYDKWNPSFTSMEIKKKSFKTGKSHGYMSAPPSSVSRKSSPAPSMDSDV